MHPGNPGAYILTCLAVLLNKRYSLNTIVIAPIMASTVFNTSIDTDTRTFTDYVVEGTIGATVSQSLIDTPNLLYTIVLLGDPVGL